MAMRVQRTPAAVNAALAMRVQRTPAAVNAALATSKAQVKRSSKQYASAVVPKLLLTPSEAALALGICRAKLYPKLMRGEIFSIKDGGRRLVPVATLEAYIAALGQGGPSRPGDGSAAIPYPTRPFI
ncbi:MAG: hypothetical protein OJF49_000311 [Ktedonobacterales bacterium]|jgi:excisionase family DNA binding protein|nr:MAG: hypothetical protein OJF49_000311 [Ktedonobacterales bacterium]